MVSRFSPQPLPQRHAAARAIAGALLGLALAASQSPALAMPATTPASPLDNSAKKIYAIAAGPLGNTLAQFAAASGVPLSFDPIQLGALQSKGLQGAYSVREGFTQLLAGSGYELVDKGDGAFSLRMLSTADAGVPQTLPGVTVTAQAQLESAYGALDGPIATRSATGTKTDSAIIETPQSISVIGAAQIDTLKAQSLMDVLGYTAGVARAEGQDRTTDTFVIRGFRAFNSSGSVYRDGSRYGVNLYNGQQEPYGLERVEILKGAASVLYGTAAPGGIINTVSKRPTSEPLRELNVELGSFQRKQVAGDFAGPLGDDGVWSYRVTALRRDSDTSVDHVKDDRDYVAPALKWQPNAATSLTLLAEYQHDLTDYVYGLPVQGTILPNVNGPIPRERFVGEPGFNQFDNVRKSIGYVFEHAFNERLKLRHTLRNFHNHNQVDYLFISGVDATQRKTLFRGALARFDRSASTAADTSLQYSWSAGGVHHTSLVGVDLLRQKHESERYRATAAPLDLYAPVYGVPLGPIVANPGVSWKERSRQRGVYAQDQMKIADKWVVLVGGRKDWTQYSERNFFGAPTWYIDNEKNDAFTGRAGLVYLAPNGVAPFISFSQSFEPTTGRDRAGQRFKPSEGEQYEAGVRWQPAGGATMLSAALYQLTQQNVGVTDPVDTDFLIQKGEVRSRGLELEATTALGKHVKLIAAYAYTDAQTIRSSPLTPEDDGKRSGGVPKTQFSLWSELDFAGLGRPGWQAGAGARYIGSTLPLQTAGKVDAFTLIDAVVSYSSGPWRFAVNASNLADKTYIASCTYGCFYGEPRRVIGTVRYKW